VVLLKGLIAPSMRPHVALVDNSSTAEGPAYAITIADRKVVLVLSRIVLVMEEASRLLQHLEVSGAAKCEALGWLHDLVHKLDHFLLTKMAPELAHLSPLGARGVKSLLCRC
jgi:hypothetical protein